jgi:hypothetical protein
MGLIREPKNVDLIINSRSLTKNEEIGISEYIRAYKIKHVQKHVSTKRKGRKTSPTIVIL